MRKLESMEKDSIYLLQKLDCNCNDCAFMVRDFDTFKKWEDWNRNLQLVEYAKAGKLLAAQGLIQKPFQFDKKGLLNYGNCNKFNKPVSFIPATIQMDTQDCFKHRRETIPPPSNFYLYHKVMSL